MTTRKTFTKEFKLEAVRLLETSEMNGSDLARELGVRRNMLYKWQKELQEKGKTDAFKGPGRKPVAGDELEQLRRKVDRLEEENEILKKAAAYFARDLT